MEPLISIIVPVYQVEDYIANTIKSIIDQEFSPFEVILVNDGTKDKSIEIAQAMLDKAKVEYSIINQENRGIAASRNTGIRNSHGKWIMMVDSDDVIAPNLLKRSYEVSSKYNSDAVFCNFQYVSLNNIFKKPAIENEDLVIAQNKILLLYLKRKLRIIFPGMLICKELIESNGLWFDETIRFGSEQHFIYKLFFITENVSYIKDELYNYLVRGGNSIMASFDTNKVLSGYNAMKDLQNVIDKNKMIKRYILPRWVFGALKSAAQKMDFQIFLDLAERMSYKKHLRQLMIFPDPRISVFSVVMALNLKMFYKLCRLLS